MSEASPFLVRAAAATPVSAASFEITAGKIDTFLTSIGLSPEDIDGKPALSKNRRTWVVPLNIPHNGERRDSKILIDKLTKKLKKPFPLYNDRGGAGQTWLWVLPGKGCVSFLPEYEELRVQSVKEKELPEMVITIVDSESDDTRYKNYAINYKDKTLEYQVYENEGRQEAKSLVKQLLKLFKMTDWKATFPGGHYGGRRDNY